MRNIAIRLRALPLDDAAQDLTEYGLLAGLIAVVAIGAVVGLGGAVDGLWKSIVEEMKDVL